MKSCCDEETSSNSPQETHTEESVSYATPDDDHQTRSRADETDSVIGSHSSVKGIHDARLDTEPDRHDPDSTCDSTSDYSMSVPSTAHKPIC